MRIEKQWLFVRINQDGEAHYAVDTVTEKERAKQANICWSLGKEMQDELWNNIKQGKFKLDSDISQRLPCKALKNGMYGQDPIFIPFPINESDRKILSDKLKEMGSEALESPILKAWDEDTAPAGPLGAISPQITQKGPVKVGTVQTRCLISWDDSVQVHSQSWILKWNYQAVKTRMKKLRHCIELTVVGPVGVQNIAKAIRR